MKLTMPWNATEAHHNGMSGTLDDVRQALGKEVDHLAHVAAQLGHNIGQQAKVVSHDAGAAAATAPRDTSRGTGTVARQILDGAAALGPTIARMSRRRVRDVGHDVQSLGQELRRVRLTTEPRRTRPDMMPGIYLLGGFGAGLALMYFLDPSRGRRRRALLRDRLTKWTRVGRETATGRARDVRNRTVGVMAEARKAVSGAVEGAAQGSEAETATYETVQRSTEEYTPEGTRVPIG